MYLYLYYKIEALIKKYEFQKKYNTLKSTLILRNPQWIPIIIIIEILMAIIVISIQMYLFYIGIVAFKTFILLILYLITGYEFWK